MIEINGSRQAVINLEDDEWERKVYDYTKTVFDTYQSSEESDDSKKSESK